MKTLFHILIASTFFLGCSPKNESNRSVNTVFIDGKEVIMISNNNGDSNKFEPDSSYFNNQKIKGIEGEGVVPN